MTPAQRSSRWMSLWGACYVVLIAAVVWSMVTARRSALTNLATTESIDNWQAWREDVKHQQENPETVQRRIPKSPEPPALVLMRDYFGVSLTGALLFTTVLYWIMAWFITGTLSTSKQTEQSN
jgi:hypothetical protein